MSNYKDAKGEVYAIQSGFTTGDIVILSDDKAAWRVNREVLTAASSVFSDMFASAITSPREIHLSDANRFTLETFITSLIRTEPRAGLPVSEVNGVIGLLCRFDCYDAARRLLYRKTSDLREEELYQAFVLANRVDCLRSACRILMQGYQWHVRRNNCYIMGTPPLAPHFRGCPWDATQASLIQPAWIMALTLAAITAFPDGSTADQWESPESWRKVAGEFMCNMSA